jgi:AraC-like DNA-binding protein
LPQPLDNNIDIGYYDVPKTRLKSEPVSIDFYRISVKSNFIDKSVSDFDPGNPKPINAVFFNSPGQPGGWDIEPTFNGMYLQISKKLIEENRFLFKNYLDYGEHEPLHYFADKLGLTLNYLGDIIKHFTQKSPLENIHEFVIRKAKEMLEKRGDLNNTEIAYELGFEYPNYFAKFFKKQVNLTPKEYRLQVADKLLNYQN